MSVELALELASEANRGVSSAAMEPFLVINESCRGDPWCGSPSREREEE